MKKQRILALALAASTAVSVFGGFSASAAELEQDAQQKFGGTEFPTYTMFEVTFDSSESTAPGYVADDEVDLPNVYTGKWGDVDSFDSNTIYLFDYTAASGADASAFGRVTNGAELDKALFAYVGNSENANKAAYTAKWDKTDTRDTVRYEVLTEFLKVVEKAEALSDGDLEDENTAWTSANNYSLDDLKIYNVIGLDGKPSEGTLAYAIDAASTTPANYSNSYLAYLTSEYNRLFNAEDGLISVLNTEEEIYDAKLEKALALEESDYTALNWAKVQAYIAEAETQYADGKVADAIDSLDVALGVAKKAPSVTDLKAALRGLFVDTADFNTAVNAAKTVATSNGGVEAVGTFTNLTETDVTIKKGKYDVNSDAWKAFAGFGADDSKEEYVAGAYRNAIYTYALAMRGDTGVGQSMVDTALDELEAAILGLNPNFTTPNWVIVKIEEALDKYTKDVVESDYKTTSTYWKKYTAAVEALEKLLDDPTLNEGEEETPIQNLETAYNNLSKCAYKVPSADLADLKASIKEAEALLKDMTGKTGDQVMALQNAKDAAAKITSTSLLSVYEKAAADLDAAIAGYNQKQGWYWDGQNWLFGKGATTVKGWLNDNGTWYYLDPTTGAMKTGWQYINGVWYLFKTGTGAGKMLTGWQKVGDTWYYLKDWGGMQTGWAKINNTWYYFQPSGAMVSNTWAWVGDKCYYFYASGAMAANTTIGGYKVDASGAWVK